MSDTTEEIFPLKPEGPEDRETAWSDEDGSRYMSRADLLEIELMRAKMEAWRASASTHRLTAEKVLRVAQERANGMVKTADSLDQQTLSMNQEYQTLMLRLAAKYGVDFQKVGYDDLTGKLTDLPEE